MSRDTPRFRCATGVVLAAAAVPAAFVVVLPGPEAHADVCANVGRRVSVSGCANLSDVIAPYAPQPQSYAPLPDDPPPPAYEPPPPPPPNVNVCANVGRRISVSGCI